ncbi:MAG: phosphosugar isomerase, partial [Pseudomonadota bacterium]
MSLTRFHTWNEIHCQPDIWTAWAPELQREATAIRDWISSRQPQAIWLSGAGTSAFIGDTLSHGPSMHPLVSLPTTDVVACPSDHLGTPGHLLCIQFGRSGDSSESVGLLDLLDAHRPDADRLHITCNPTGALAKRPAPGPGETRVLRLPEATHDRGFAMTSSYTTMLLSALACLTDALPNLPALSTEA